MSITHKTTREPIVAEPYRASNVFIISFFLRSQTMMTGIVIICVLIGLVMVFASMYLDSEIKRRDAEDNIVQNFYSDGSGYYRRMSIMPNTHILAFVDNYLTLRHSWDPQTLPFNLSEAKKITHAQLIKHENKKVTNLDNEEGKSILDNVRSLATQRISQTIKRELDSSRYPYQIIPKSFGYAVRVFVTQDRKAYNKAYSGKTFPMCFALVQVDPNSLDWGLETGKWEKHCEELPLHNSGEVSQ